MTGRIVSILILAGLALSSTAQAAPVVEKGQARYLPWSGYWWPMKNGGILKPLGKHDRITGKKAVDWEKGNTPEKIERWFGYCHAWAASAVMEKQPEKVKAATAQDREKVSLGVGDQKGWLAACHTADVANVHGRRYRSGGSEDAKQDLAPDELWRLLKRYVGKQGVPLILDVEAGPEVWNYPVYAYRIEHQPLSSDNGQRMAQMTLWMADNSVPADYVGLKVRRHSYAFTFRMREGAIVMGSGQWSGQSKVNHPDFAWYPFVAVPENPQVDYRQVKKILGNPSSPTPVPEPERFDPNNPQPERQPRPNVLVLSPMELAVVVANRTSSFVLDVTVDRFDGATYHPGEPIWIRGQSQKGGYLYLIGVDPKGDLELLYPQPGQDNQIKGGESFKVGTMKKPLLSARKPLGVHRIKAIVTSRPLELTGQTHQQDQQGQRQSFHWHPTQRQQMQQLMQQYLKGKLKPQELQLPPATEILGEFAQDEVSFYVGPVRKESTQPKKPGKPSNQQPTK